MRQKWFGTACIVMALWMLAGCGGGSSTPSPFAGTWSGTFTSPANGNISAQNGTVQVTIATNGATTGIVDNLTTNANATVSGSIANTGTANFTYTYPGATYTASGTVAINGQGQLTGILQSFSGSTLFAVETIILTKQ